jgi:hypothetical protein
MCRIGSAGEPVGRLHCCDDPAADVGECGFETDIRLNQSRDLTERIFEVSNVLGRRSLACTEFG